MGDVMDIEDLDRRIQEQAARLDAREDPTPSAPPPPAPAEGPALVVPPSTTGPAVLDAGARTVLDLRLIVKVSPGPMGDQVQWATLTPDGPVDPREGMFALLKTASEVVYATGSSGAPWPRPVYLAARNALRALAEGLAGAPAAPAPEAEGPEAPEAGVK